MAEKQQAVPPRGQDNLREMTPRAPVTQIKPRPIPKKAPGVGSNPAQEAPEAAPPANRGQFQPGQSGNPQGRPKGSLNKATLLAQAFLDGEAEALTRKAVELAVEGNIPALKLCIPRLLPPRRERLITLEDFPALRSPADTLQALTAVLEAISQGEITPAEGQHLVNIIAACLKVMELVDLEARLTALEERVSSWPARR